MAGRSCHLSQTLLVVLLGLGVLAAPARADNTPQPLYPYNPLQQIIPDPLMPSHPLTTPQAQERFDQDLNNLDQQAQAQMRQGDLDGAFQTWFRELRLRRFQGPGAEITALGRIGAIAWQQQRTTELRFITERLEALQQTNSLSLLLAEQLGWAYQQVRDPQGALGVYGPLLAAARQHHDQGAQVNLLSLIGAVYLAWFDYPQAAATYQQLLTFAPLVPLPPGTKVASFLHPKRPVSHQVEGPNTLGMPPAPPLSRAEILEKLVFIYDHNQQAPETITTLQALIKLYQYYQYPNPIPGLILAIADQYNREGQVNQALTTYQAAYAQAIPLREYNNAATALSAIAQIYLAQHQLAPVLQVYQYLLDVDQNADDQVGQMNTLDAIAQVYITQKNYSQALAFLEQAQQLSVTLHYREEYFAAQIQRLKTLGGD